MFGKLVQRENYQLFPQNSEAYLNEGMRSAMFNIACYLENHRPILITGTSGCGKTTLIETASRLLGARPPVKLHLGNKQTDIKSLIGLYTTTDQPGIFKWNKGILLKAIEEGLWIVLEDVDLIPQDILMTIMQILEQGKIYLPNKNMSIRCHSSFKIFGTLKNKESLYFLPDNKNWSLVELAPFTDQELKSLLEFKYSKIKHFDYAQLCIDVFKMFLSAKETHTHLFRSALTATSLFRYSKRINKVLSTIDKDSIEMKQQLLKYAIEVYMSEYDLEEHEAYYNCLLHVANWIGLSHESVKILTTTYEATIRVQESTVSIGHSNFKLVKKELPLSHEQPDANYIYTRYHKQLMEKILSCIEHNEPVLLVGETGTGKTTILQNMAKLTNNRLNIINMSQQSEASDLMGGYRPIDRTTNVKLLHKEFLEIFDKTFSIDKNYNFVNTLNQLMNNSKVDMLIACYKKAIIKFKQVYSAEPLGSNIDEPPAKKINLHLEQDLNIKWQNFIHKVHAIDSSKNRINFQYAEGILTKCISKGEWILLDEINLATIETLSCLVSLLDKNGSITLSDRGDTEPLKKHPNFKIFACMNPATGIGKSDLPLSVKSKFSQIFVFPVERNKSDLELIINQILSKFFFGPRLNHLVENIVTFYYQCISLQTQRTILDSSEMPPSYSLRTLCRALNMLPQLMVKLGFDLNTALIHSFQTFFETSLNNSSADAMNQLISSILLKDIPASFFIHANSQLLKHISYEHVILGNDYTHKDFEYISVSGFPMLIGNSTIDTKQNKYVLTHTIKLNLKKIARALCARNYPILLQGPTSSGKTSMVKYLANISGNVFIRINNHEHTDLQEYIGSYVFKNGSFVFQEGPLVIALRRGYWLLLDELNLAPSEILEALNRLLDDNRELYVPEIEDVIKPHKNFQIFATQNPSGSIYGGRKNLSVAFKNRFVELNIDEIPMEELEIILSKSSNLPKSYSKLMIETYQNLKQAKQITNILGTTSSVLTLRDLFKWSSRCPQNKRELAHHAYCLFAERTRNDVDKQNIKAIVEKSTKCKIETDSMYLMEDILALFTPEQQQRLKNIKHITWTYSMRRMLYLTKLCVINKEPVLLVGETGCGKTQLCEIMSLLQGSKLSVVNCHQNTETSDFIGSQRPLRNTKEMKNNLFDELRQLTFKIEKQCTCAELESSNLTGNYTIENLEKLLNCKDGNNKMSAMFKNKHQQNCSSLVYKSGVNAILDQLQNLKKACFRWVDGPLVKCVKEGHVFLMDEISLAEDSVLERMNSLLEKERTLYISEDSHSVTNGIETSFIKAKDEFIFLATMNPGTDFGKKELSPALRNRFTEIWVPSGLNDKDMHQFLLNSINHEILNDSKQHVSNAMLAFSKWLNKKVKGQCGLFSEEHVLSLRDFKTWTSFVNSQKQHEINASVLHGLFLVYLDSVGTDSCLYTKSTLTQYDSYKFEETLLEYKVECIRKLCELLSDNSTENGFIDEIRFSTSYDIIQTPTNCGIHPFYVPKGCQSSDYDYTNTVKVPKTNSNIRRLLRAMQINKPILLEGEPGAGKTKSIEILSGLTANKLVRLNLSEQTDIMDLFGCDLPCEEQSHGGTNIPNFEWKSSALIEAIENGDWILLDEINLANQSVLEGLNSCLDHRQTIYIPEIDRTIKPNKNGKQFRIFATMNSSSRNIGRKSLPKSFLNRFTNVYIEALKKDDMEIIIRTILNNKSLENLACKIIDFNYKCLEYTKNNKDNSIQYEFNVRDMLRWIRIVNEDLKLTTTDISETSIETFQGFLDKHVDLLYFQRFRSIEDRKHIHNLYNTTFYDKKSSKPMEYFASNKLEITISDGQLKCGSSCLEIRKANFFTSSYSYDSVTHSTMNSYTKYLMDCINLNWMVILEGSYISNKTNVIRYLSCLTNNTLTEFNISNDSDVGDLLGGYEQKDISRNINNKRYTVTSKIFTIINIHLIWNSNTTVASYDWIKYLYELDSFLLQISNGLRAKNYSVHLYKIDSFIKNLHTMRKEVDEKSLLIAFDEILLELQSIEQLIKIHTNETSNGALFEWVEGPLLKAIKEGHWFVINNANMANPSVMDRLVPLVEETCTTPKYFKIQERGIDAKTKSTYEYKVHKRFRLFLLVNKGNNESASMLSRPMRNRGIEICMLDDCFPDTRMSTNINQLRLFLKNDYSLAKAKLLVQDVSFQNKKQTEIDLYSYDKNLNKTFKKNIIISANDFESVMFTMDKSSSIVNMLHMQSVKIYKLSNVLFNASLIVSFMYQLKYLLILALNKNNLKCKYTPETIVEILNTLIAKLLLESNIEALNIIQNILNDFEESANLDCIIDVVMAQLKDKKSVLSILQNTLRSSLKNLYFVSNSYQTMAFIKEISQFQTIKDATNYISSSENSPIFTNYYLTLVLHNLVLRCYKLENMMKDNFILKIQNAVKELGIEMGSNGFLSRNLNNLFNIVVDFIHELLLHLAQYSQSLPIRAKTKVTTTTKQLIETIHTLICIIKRPSKMENHVHEYYNSLRLISENIYEISLISNFNRKTSNEIVMFVLDNISQFEKINMDSISFHNIVIFPRNLYILWKGLKCFQSFSVNYPHYYSEIVNKLKQHKSVCYKNVDLIKAKLTLYNIIDRLALLLVDNNSDKMLIQQQLNDVFSDLEYSTHLSNATDKERMNVFDKISVSKSNGEEVNLLSKFIILNNNAATQSQQSFQKVVKRWIETSVICGNCNYENHITWLRTLYQRDGLFQNSNVLSIIKKALDANLYPLVKHYKNNLVNDSNMLFNWISSECFDVSNDKILLRDVIECNTNALQISLQLLKENIYDNSSSLRFKRSLYMLVLQSIILILLSYKKHIEKERFGQLNESYQAYLSSETLLDGTKELNCKLFSEVVKKAIKCIETLDQVLVKDFLCNHFLGCMSCIEENLEDIHTVMRITGYIFIKMLTPEMSFFDPSHESNIKCAIKSNNYQIDRVKLSVTSILYMNKYGPNSCTEFEDIMNKRYSTNNCPLLRDKNQIKIKDHFKNILQVVDILKPSNITHHTDLSTLVEELLISKNKIEEIDTSYKDLSQPILLGVNMLLYGLINTDHQTSIPPINEYGSIASLFSCSMFDDDVKHNWEQIVVEMKSLKSDLRINNLTYTKMIRLMHFELTNDIFSKHDNINKSEFMALMFINEQLYNEHQHIVQIKLDEKKQGIYKTKTYHNEDLTQEEQINRDIEKYFPQISEYNNNNATSHISVSKKYVYNLDLFQMMYCLCEFSSSNKHSSKIVTDFKNKHTGMVELFKIGLLNELSTKGILSNTEKHSNALRDYNNLARISKTYMLESDALIQDGHSYNFYKSCNFPKTKEIVELMRKVTSFFEGLNNDQMYSSPSTIQLMDEIKNINTTKISSPLMTFVSKLDKLYCRVTEIKQILAQEEDLYQNIIQIETQILKKIIELRKYELLNIVNIVGYKHESEIKRCVKDFWYETYYSMVFALTKGESLSIATLDEEYIKKMCTTIHAFYLNSSIGRFSTTLKIMKTITIFLRLSSIHDDSVPANLEHLISTLDNLNSYYCAFEERISNDLETLKAKHIKEISTIVSLANLKDDNYDHIKDTISRTQAQVVKNMSAFTKALNGKFENYLSTNYYASLETYRLDFGQTASGNDCATSQISMINRNSNHSIKLGFIEFDKILVKVHKINSMFVNDHCSTDVIGTDPLAEPYNTALLEIEDLSKTLFQKLSTDNAENLEYIKSIKLIKKRCLCDLFSKLKETKLKYSYFGIETFIRMDIDKLAFIQEKFFIGTKPSSDKNQVSINDVVNNNFYNLIFKIMNIKYLKINNTGSYPSTDFSNDEINCLFSFLTSITVNSSRLEIVLNCFKLSVDKLNDFICKLINRLNILEANQKPLSFTSHCFQKLSVLRRYLSELLKLESSPTDNKNDINNFNEKLKIILCIAEDNIKQLAHIQERKDMTNIKELNPYYEKYQSNATRLDAIVCGLYGAFPNYSHLIDNIQSLTNATIIKEFHGQSCSDHSSNGLMSNCSSGFDETQLASCSNIVINSILNTYEKIQAHEASYKINSVNQLSIENETKEILEVIKLANLTEINKHLSNFAEFVEGCCDANNLEDIKNKLRAVVSLAYSYKVIAECSLSYTTAKIHNLSNLYHRLVVLFKDLMLKGYDLPELNNESDSEQPNKGEGQSGSNETDGCGIDGTDVNNTGAKDISEKIESESQINNEDKENLNDQLNDAGEAIEAKNEVNSECESFTEEENSNDEDGIENSDNEAENTKGDVDENELNIDENFWNENFSDADQKDDDDSEQENTKDDAKKPPQEQDLNPKSCNNDNDKTEDQIDLEQKDTKQSDENNAVPEENSNDSNKKEDVADIEAKSIDDEWINTEPNLPLELQSDSDENSLGENSDAFSQQEEDSKSIMDIDEEDNGISASEESTNDIKDEENDIPLSNHDEEIEGVATKNDKNKLNETNEKQEANKNSNTPNEINEEDIGDNGENNEKNGANSIAQKDNEIEDHDPNRANNDKLDKKHDSAEQIDCKQMVDYQDLLENNDNSTPDLLNENVDYEMCNDMNETKIGAMHNANDCSQTKNIHDYNSEIQMEDRKKDENKQQPMNYDLDHLESFFDQEGSKVEALQIPSPIKPKEKEDKESVNTSYEKEPIIDNHKQFDMCRSQILWKKYELSTTRLAQLLGQRLKSIIEPNVKSQLKGDYKSGKKLNMRKIIPYIASEYKNDKIWMKREKMSSRKYRIMISIDDSYSMKQDLNTIHTTFKSLALVSQALNICGLSPPTIIQFGTQQRVLVDENTEKINYGGKIISSFNFDQKETNLASLINFSLKTTFHEYKEELFEKNKLIYSSDNEYSINIILSDGMFYNHKETYKLVKYAKQNKLVSIFVAIENADESVATGNKLKEVNNVEFMPDGTVKITNYMDTFPFEFFVVVQNINQMPDIISSIITQFFNNIKEQ